MATGFQRTQTEVTTKKSTVDLTVDGALLLASARETLLANQ